MKRLTHWFVALLLLPGSGYAFSLDDLQAQLHAQAVVRGQFTQEKYLRSLNHPLTSRGDFVLTAENGLLWLLRQPITQELRVTPQGVSRRDTQGQWQPLPEQLGRRGESRLFLAVLAGDTRGLREHFDLALSGDRSAWRMTITPRSALLRQIFEVITIEGGPQVSRIELRETQGDRTVLHMKQIQASRQLTPDEERAYAQ